MSYITYAGVELECDVCHTSIWVYEQPTIKNLIQNAEEDSVDIGGWIIKHDQHICPDCQMALEGN